MGWDQNPLELDTKALSACPEKRPREDKARK